MTNGTDIILNSKRRTMQLQSLTVTWQTIYLYENFKFSYKCKICKCKPLSNFSYLKSRYRDWMVRWFETKINWIIRIYRIVTLNLAKHTMAFNVQCNDIAEIKIPTEYVCTDISSSDRIFLIEFWCFGKIIFRFCDSKSTFCYVYSSFFRYALSTCDVFEKLTNSCSYNISKFCASTIFTR